MTSQCIFNMLDFLHTNITNGEDTIEECRRFVGGMKGLDGAERRFLEFAVRDRLHVEFLHSVVFRPAHKVELPTEGAAKLA